MKTSSLSARVSLAVSLALASACAGACSIPPPSATITVGGDGGLPAPSSSPTEWYPVADYLEHRCGALDCHGDPQRNLIIYGQDGLRLPSDPPCPGDGGAPGLDAAYLVPGGAGTTCWEYSATYRSLVGLEPVVMGEVVASGGQNPADLTFVRKAEGLENHKGGTLIVLGTDAGALQDDCITSWLAGNPTSLACTQAVNITQ